MGRSPPHWSDLVKQSVDLSTDATFDLATTWANDFINDRVVSVAEEDGGNASEILLNQPTQGVQQLLPAPEPETEIVVQEPPVVVPVVGNDIAPARLPQPVDLLPDPHDDESVLNPVPAIV